MVPQRKLKFSLKMEEIQNSEKIPCQNVVFVAKVDEQGFAIPNCSQINFRKRHQVFGGLSSCITLTFFPLPPPPPA